MQGALSLFCYQNRDTEVNTALMSHASITSHAGLIAGQQADAHVVCRQHADQTYLTAISRSIWVDDNVEQVVMHALDGYTVTGLQIVLPHVRTCKPTPDNLQDWDSHQAQMASDNDSAAAFQKWPCLTLDSLASCGQMHMTCTGE